MKLKGLVWFFAIALILISVYQLSFTWVVNSHEAKMKEKAERMVSRLEGDLKRRSEGPSLDRRALCCLQRTPTTNPLLYVVETALATEPVKFGQRPRIRRRPREGTACAGLRI